MMTARQIEAATREQLADELAAAGEYTMDWRDATMDDLRERARAVARRHARGGTAAPAQYAISVRRSWYGPRVTHQRHLSDRDGQEWRGTRAEAMAKVAELDAAVYYTASGEVGRATYTIVRAMD